MKRSSHNYCGREEEKIYQEEYRDFLLEQKGVKHLDALLLDSSLISTTKNKTYYFKVRAYAVDSTGKKVYGAWSKVKKVK